MAKKQIKAVSNDPKEKVLSNGDLYRIKKGLETLENIPGNSTFTFKLAKNLRIIGNEINDLNKTIKPTKAYQEEYQPQQEVIAKKYCINDENGKPVLTILNDGTGQYNFTPENKKLFDEEVKELELLEKNVELVAIRQKQVDDFSDLLDKPCEVVFSKISKSDIPNGLTLAQVSNIFELFYE